MCRLVHVYLAYYFLAPLLFRDTGQGHEATSIRARGLTGAHPLGLNNVVRVQTTLSKEPWTSCQCCVRDVGPSWGCCLGPLSYHADVGKWPQGKPVRLHSCGNSNFRRMAAGRLVPRGMI